MDRHPGRETSEGPAINLSAAAVSPSAALRALLSGALALALPHGTLAAALFLPSPPARALELRGQTYFLSPPWKVRLRNYYWYADQSGGEYYITIDLPEKADASLGALQILQTRGVDRSFSFDERASRAFLGLPRREGAKVPVVVRFDDNQRLFRIDFPEPVPPGSTLTVALRPYRNPSQPDSYMFQVTAFPAGPDPVASPVGFVTLSILQSVSF
ncbi:DUF2808 domain-containing protein [Cyanobium sp. ATX 6F1]|nr:DUF2808 domain-containing protein [Cyanobium sp. ATX 6F1]